MEKTRNKDWRRFQQCRVFKARMQKFSSWGYTILDEVGNRIDDTHWFEIARQRWAKKYKDSSTPCSCAICTAEKYSRLLTKKETERILSESFE